MEANNVFEPSRTMSDWFDLIEEVDDFHNNVMVPKQAAWDPLEGYHETVRGKVLPIPEEVKIFKRIGDEANRIMRRDFIKPRRGDNHPSRGYEVGDDRVDLSQSPSSLATGLACQEEIFKMKTSPEDTFISPLLYNFCEVTSLIPSGKRGSFGFARKNGDFANLEFVDVAPIRIVLDVTKSDRSHSSTAVGKASMLGIRQNTPKLEHGYHLMVASFMQDSFLRTWKSPDPKYLPRIMGGSGCRPLWSAYQNAYLYVLAYRGGGYERVYASAKAELEAAVRDLDRGVPATAIICAKLRDKQEYLHGTYAEKIFVPRKPTVLTGTTSMPEPIMESHASAWTSSFEHRLIRARALITERDATVQFEASLRLEELLFGDFQGANEAVEFFSLQKKRGRALFEGALNSNSAFKNLLDRRASPSDVEKLLGDKDFIPVVTGRLRFSKEDARWLSNGGKGNVYTMEDIPLHTNLYIRSEVSSEETLKVGGLTLSPIIENQLSLTTTVSHIGMYKIGRNQEEWANSLLEDMKGIGIRPVPFSTLFRIFTRSPEWVNDDSALIGAAIEDSKGLTKGSFVYVLITNDKKLCRRMADSTNVEVVMLQPEDAMRILPVGMTWSSNTRIRPSDLRGKIYIKTSRIARVYIDTGAVAASLSRMAIHGNTSGARTVYKTSNVTSERIIGFVRRETVQLDPIGPVEQINRLLWFSPGDRRNRRGRFIQPPPGVKMTTWDLSHSGSSSDSDNEYFE